jgi:hypothetical protein
MPMRGAGLWPVHNPASRVQTIDAGMMPVMGHYQYGMGSSRNNLGKHEINLSETKHVRKID